MFVPEILPQSKSLITFLYYDYKKEFPSNDNHLLADSAGFIVNTFQYVWEGSCSGEPGPFTETPVNRQTDMTVNITFATPLPDIKPQPPPKASRLSCLLIQWFSIRSAQIEKWFQCLEFRPTLFSRLSFLELFTVENLFGNFKWPKCLNKFKLLVSHINGQIKPSVFVG